MKAEDFRKGNFVNLKNWQDEIGFFSEFDITQEQFDSIVQKGEGFDQIISINKDEVELMAYCLL